MTPEHKALVVLLRQQSKLGPINVARGAMRDAADAIESLSSSPPAPAVPDAVEALEIAKIIDPHSFLDIPFTDDPVLLDMVEQSKQDAIRKAERILATLAASHMPVGDGYEPYLWQCKDYVDGWITYTDREEALAYQRDTGCLLRITYRPLAASTGEAGR